MYTTMRYYPSGSELVDALAERQDDVRRIIGGITGFRAYYLVRLDDGAAVSISVFDDRNGAEESTRAAAAWVAENLSGLAIAPPMASSGEVAFSF